MRFFRGIAVPSAFAEAIITVILEKGLIRDQGKWRTTHYHPGPLEPLFVKSNLSPNDTRPSDADALAAVCASVVSQTGHHIMLGTITEQPRTTRPSSSNSTLLNRVSQSTVRIFSIQPFRWVSRRRRDRYLSAVSARRFCGMPIERGAQKINPFELHNAISRYTTQML